MIQECVDDIVNLKFSSAWNIDFLFSALYAKSVLRMLLKLGVEEEDIYVFDTKKKRLRGVLESTYGICYRILSTKKEAFDEHSVIEYNGIYYEFGEYSYSEGFSDVNTFPLLFFDMKRWNTLYNYIRIDYNSKDKSKIVIKKH